LIGLIQVVASRGRYQVTFRARERHVTQWTQLTEGNPAIVQAGLPNDNRGIWDPELRDVSMHQQKQQ